MIRPDHGVVGLTVLASSDQDGSILRQCHPCGTLCSHPVPARHLSMLDPCPSSTSLAAVKGAIQVMGSIVHMSSQGLTEAGCCTFERTAIMEEDPWLLSRLELWTARDAKLSVGLGGSCRRRNVLPIVVAFLPGLDRFHLKTKPSPTRHLHNSCAYCHCKLKTLSTPSATSSIPHHA